MAKILIVEDDAELCTALKRHLSFEHYTVEIADNGDDGMQLLETYKFDLAILDWQVPGLSGIDIIKKLRSVGSLTPVLMLTGKDHIQDKGVGFAAGADDYLTKPFDLQEVSMRVKALLRRAAASPSSALRVGDIELDGTTYSVMKRGESVKLLPREFALLEFFMRNKNMVFSTNDLLDRVWSSASDASPDAVVATIRRLRKKIDDEGSESIIKNLHGIGYRLDDPDAPGGPN